MASERTPDLDSEHVRLARPAYLKARLADPAATLEAVAGRAGLSLATARALHDDPRTLVELGAVQDAALASARAELGGLVDKARVRREILADALAARDDGDLRTSIAGWTTLGKDLGMFAPPEIAAQIASDRAALLAAVAAEGPEVYRRVLERLSGRAIEAKP